MTDQRLRQGQGPGRDLLVVEDDDVRRDGRRQICRSDDEQRGRHELPEPAEDGLRPGARADHDDEMGVFGGHQVADAEVMPPWPAGARTADRVLATRSVISMESSSWLRDLRSAACRHER